jgi:hypothetical protein
MSENVVWPGDRRIAGSRALELAGLRVDDLDFVDVYAPH